MKPHRLETAPGVFAIGCAAEHRLRQLFRREAELMRELAAIRAEQRDARNQYADANGLLMRPGVESLRRIVG